MKGIRLFLLGVLLSNALFANDASISRRFVVGAQNASLTGNWALWKNPAGLGFLQGSEASFIYFHEWLDIGDREHFGGNIAAEIFNGLKIGAGFGTRAAFTRLSRNNLGTDLHAGLGLAFKTSNTSTLGLSFIKSYNFLTEQASSTAITLGLQSRLSEYIAFGLSFEKLTDSFFSPLNISVGTSLRPFSNAITFGLDATLKRRGTSYKDGYRVDPEIGIKTVVNGIEASINASFHDVTKGLEPPMLSLSFTGNLPQMGATLFGVINPSVNNYAVGTQIRSSSAEYKSFKKQEGYWVRLHINEQGTLEETPKGLAQRLFAKEQSQAFTLALLNRIAQDKSISGVAITVAGFEFGDANAKQWRDALLNLRKQNKQVIVFLDDPNARDYYIATGADTIYMNNKNTLTLKRLQQTLIYLKDTLKKAGIKAESVTAGSYKTAPRMFVNNEAKKEELIVINNILNNFYTTLVDETAKARKLDKERVKRIFDQGEIDAEIAEMTGLIDEAIFEDQIDEKINSIKGPAPIFDHYEHRQFKKYTWKEPKKIAIIPVKGAIVEGRIPPSLLPSFQASVGDKDVIDEIEQAVKDPRIDGIIMHIDSPGGSAVASHRINRALIKAQEKKPVISLLGDVAASGGYLVAVGTQHIIAEPNTITGSIGVFSLHFSLSELADTLKINEKEISAIKKPGPTVFRSLTTAERRQAQKIVDWHYKNFINAVASGLEQDRDIIKKHANGRVWLGKEAYKRKLIHELGGFYTATKAMRRLADIKEDEEIVLEVLKPGDASEILLGGGVLSKLSSKYLKNALDSLSPIATTYQKTINSFRLNNKVQARLPFDIIWDE